MKIIIGRQNVYTYTLDIVAKTITISGILNFSIYADPNKIGGIIGIYDATAVKSIPTDGATVSKNSVDGLDVFVVTFVTIPSGVANSDTLNIDILVDYDLAGEILLEYITGTPVPPPIPVFPILSGWIADFDFNNPDSLTIVSGKVSAITDTVGNVVSSQSNASFRPAYHASGGSNDTGYATFTGTQLLTGNLLTSNLDFTVVAIRRTNNGGVTDAELGVFENGNYADGWGIVDWQNSVAGGYLNARTALPGRDFYNWDLKWESVSASHASGSNKTYNTVTNSFPIASTNFPNAPTVYHHIGFMDAPGINGFKGDISRILVYDRQLSDAEVKSLNDYFIYAYSLELPNQLICGGDSKMTTLGGAPSCPQQILGDLQTSNSYTYLINTAVSGMFTTDVIAILPTEVLPKYQSRITNYYTIMIGYNDLAAGASAATVYANIVTICQTVRAAGFKVVIMTDIYSTNAAVNAKTDTVNTSIRANWATFADGLADTNALPQAQDPNNPTYFFDGLHPTAALDAIMAALVEPILLTL